MKAEPKEIVVIDGSLLSCKILEVALQRAGYRVHSFTHPPEALRTLFHGERSPPGLLFVSLSFPASRGDGLQTIQRLRKHFASVPIISIGVSTRGQVLSRLLARLAGANAYVTKPYVVEQIVAVTRTMLPST